MSHILVIKMLSGEELLAQFVSADAEFLTINRPRVMQLQQTERGVQASLASWVISAPDQKDIQMSQRSIAAYFEAPADVSKLYLQATSGLILG